jgi:hypothetical protein
MSYSPLQIDNIVSRPDADYAPIEITVWALICYTNYDTIQAVRFRTHPMHLVSELGDCFRT